MIFAYDREIIFDLFAPVRMAHQLQIKDICVRYFEYMQALFSIKSGKSTDFILTIPKTYILGIVIPIPKFYVYTPIYTPFL